MFYLIKIPGKKDKVMDDSKFDMQIISKNVDKAGGKIFTITNKEYDKLLSKSKNNI